MAYIGGGAQPIIDWGARDRIDQLQDTVTQLQRQVAQLQAALAEAATEGPRP